MQIQIDSDYAMSLGGDDTEPEVKLWSAVLSMAMIDALDGDGEAVEWLQQRDGVLSYICHAFFDLNEDYLCGLMKRKNAKRQRVSYTRDTMSG